MYQGSIKELHQQLVNKEQSAVEIAQATLKHIEAVEPKVKAFLAGDSRTSFSYRQEK